MFNYALFVMLFPKHKSYLNTMGKGDKKTRRGKIANKSYGAKRTGKIKRKPTIEERIRVDKKM